MIVRGATERAGLLLAHRIIALDRPLVSTKADTTGFVVFSRRSVLLAIVGLAGCSRAVQTELADPLVTNSFAALPDEPEVSANELTKRNPELARQLVPYNGPEQPGTVIVRTNERKLYYVLDEGRAVRYPVGVGRAGKQWQGRAEIEGKHVNPAWSPPEEVLRDNPRLPAVYPGGSPDNPMGPRALTLSGGEGYAIHGTSRPHSIGTFASYGCIRMFNEDILDLFERVKVGTEVLVTL
jgi:lipoprotein-anchoring transpeptidase ErfK/SrfK